MAQCAQLYTIPIFQQSCQMIYVASDMLKGQRVAFVLIILLMLYSIKRNHSEWGTDQMCANTTAQKFTRASISKEGGAFERALHI